ncbi:MAG: arginase [Naasia sp.]|nr:arginase [Naasia sp.]
MRLADGANVISGDLPSSRTTVVEVPLGAGESLGSGVARYSSLREVRDRIAVALDGSDEPAIVIGGDCGVELAAVEHVLRTRDDPPAVVWLDAHPDLGALTDRPRAFCGTVARAIVGDGADGLSADPALPPSRFVAAGTRSIDDDEQEYVDAHGIPVILCDALGAGAIADAVAATGATRVYVHIDLDVLDPAEIGGLADPQPFGVALPALVAELRELVARFPLAGAGITMFAPDSLDGAGGDLPTILRLLSALTAPEPAAA